MELPAPLDLIPSLLPGAVLTLEITVAAMMVGVVMAFTAGLVRLSRCRPASFLAATYIEVFRGTSALVQLYFAFYVLPLFGLTLSPFNAGVAALGLNVGAYGAEIVRGAIVSIEKGQREAAIALSMSPALTMRRIILPQAVVSMLPPFGNLVIELLKFSSLAAFITLAELTFTGNLLFQTEGRREEIYVVTLGMYFAIAIVFTLLFRYAERRLSRHFIPGVRR
ncbi:ectoine/hydroxyectoine ABC transporter permease subunit EhuC [Mesorhizobium sp. Root172]|jgi:polar amino acid transport system permease protein|uniref:ectoine/hydroxyectoine ABC transporter permease subunit EhuC n=1 Tax=Mesorhizobium sp. Root172 TaxID=1736481 RepID=UPI0006F2E431|nr:ectoine/hydroxyectoine ABC transporter permease subunit EhuC [Mesorhizobium sp. Root172]KRB29677.1 hypothetical protein ASE05_30890 [Mesorhizobium sp. Root172]